MTDREAEFDATIETEGKGAHVVVPAAAVDALGGGKARIPVQATFDAVEYQGSVVSMGGSMLLGMTKAVRSALGKDIGDTVHVVVRRDTSERKVEVPADLAEALAAAGVRAAFDKLSYSHQRQHVLAVEEAKKPETRARRIEACVDMVTR